MYLGMSLPTSTILFFITNYLFSCKKEKEEKEEKEEKDKKIWDLFWK